MTTPFTREQWEALVKETVDRVLFLGISKGAEYSKEGDFLGNMRTQAATLGTSISLVWGVLAGKHWNACCTYISDMVNGTTRERSEPLDGKIDDLITYLLLFKAIVREQEGEKPAWNAAGQVSQLAEPGSLDNLLPPQFKQRCAQYHARSLGGRCVNCGLLPSDHNICRQL